MPDIKDYLENLSSDKKALLALKALRNKSSRVEEIPSTSISAIPRVDGLNRFPLSFAQQRIWFLEQFEKGSSRYNFCNAYKIKGKLDLRALEYALNQIIKRHEVWRTTFQYFEGEAMQIVSPEVKINIKVIDMKEKAEEEVYDFVQGITENIVDLTKLPLIDPIIINISEDEQLFLWVTHHIINDGGSIGNFVIELEQFYNNFETDKLSKLSDISIQYGDFSLWQRNWLKGSILENQIEYWKKKLGGELPVLELPTDRIRQAIKTTNADFVYANINKELRDKLKNLGIKEGCTTFMTLLTAFKVLLYRYTGQEDIIVGSPISNRKGRELEGLIGFFANTIVLRTRVEGELSFSELLNRVKETSLEAYEYQDVPFEKLVDELQVKRDLSNTPIFQVMFTYESDEDKIPNLLGVEVEPYSVEGKTGSFDITLYLTESDQGIKLKLSYNPDLFDEITVQRLLRHYEILLSSATENPSGLISELPILPEEEEQKLILEWNDTSFKFTEATGIHGLFEEQVKLVPYSIAATFEGKSYTYRELNEKSNQLANYILSKGISKGKKIALYMDRSLELLVGLIAILKSGAAYVPIDPTYPRDRIGYMFKEAQVFLVVTTSDLVLEVDGLKDLDKFCIDTQWDLVTNCSFENPEVDISPENAAYIIFTSGSTGKPKGVVIEHRNILNYAQGILKNMEFTPGLSYAIVTTFAADLGLTTLWGALCSGGELHIITYDRAADPESFAEYFRKNSIDVLKIVPSHFEALKGIANLRDIIPNKCLIFGGEASNWDIISKIRAIKPECRIINHYGPTETTVGTLIYNIMDRGFNDSLNNVPLGRPLPNTRTYILDTSMQLVPIGVAGELYIGGEGVTSGYLNRPEVTAEKYVPDLFGTEPGKSLYRTGDLAKYLPDGNIEFLGRLDGQVKIRGYRIEIGEIETLLRNHNLLKDCVVIVREDKPGEKQLIAYVVLKVENNENYSAGILREYLKKQLPNYMVPAAFVQLKVIPLNANGKIDRLSLPMPDNNRRESEDGFVAPRNKEEANMVKIWSQVLEIKKIGIDDNFFDLGGDSFKAIKVVRSIGSKVGVMELFRNPTIRELAVHLSSNNSKKRNVLHELTKPIPMNRKVVSLICVPYGGASAITFQPLANVMPRNYSLYSVELPGHDYSCPDEALVSLEESANRCFEEIKANVKGPIVLYGHCLGGSLVMILAKMLEAAGIKVDGILMGAIFPSPRLSNKFFDFWAKIFPNVLSEKGYRDLLKSVGGLNDTISADESKFMLRNLRHDSIESEEAFTKFYNNEEKTKFKAPITCVVGQSDRMTEFYQERYKEWGDFTETVDLKVIDFAGHYFQKHQALELSNIIEEKVDLWQGRVVPSSKDVEIDTMAEDTYKIKTSMEKQINPSMKLFLIVAVAQLISSLGSILSGFATGIWVYKQSGALSEFAMMFLIGLLPTILLLPLSGAIADRVDRRLILILCDMATALTSLWLFILLSSNNLQLFHIYIIIVVGSVAGAFKRPAYMAAITQISPKKYFMQANSISQFSGAIGGIMAPVFGGIFIEIIGFKGIVVIDFLTFLIAIATLIFVKFPNTMFRRQEEPIIKEIIGGWNFIIKRKSLVAMVIFFIVCNFFESMFDVIVTPLCLTFSKPSSLGIILAFSAIGTLVGSIIMMVTGGVKKRAKGMVGFMIFSAISIMVAGLKPSAVFVSIALFGFGLSVALVDIHWQSIIQVKVGLELQGRVFAINQMLAWSMRPFSYISAGVLADHVFEPIMKGNNTISQKLGPVIGSGVGRGMGLMLIIAGGILFVWTIIGFKYKPLCEMDDILLDAVPDAITVKDKDILQELADKKVKGITRNQVEVV